MHKYQLTLVYVSLREVEDWFVGRALQSQVAHAWWGHYVLQTFRGRILVLGFQLVGGNLCDGVNPHLDKATKDNTPTREHCLAE